MNKNTMKDLIDIAEKWSQFTRKDGRNHKSYCDDFIHSYHADNSDHRTVKFGKYPEQVEICFLHPPRITATVSVMENLDYFVDRAVGLLELRKDEEKKRSKKEKDEEKQKRIAILRQELQELSA